MKNPVADVAIFISSGFSSRRRSYSFHTLTSGLVESSPPSLGSGAAASPPPSPPPPSPPSLIPGPLPPRPSFGSFGIFGVKRSAPPKREEPRIIVGPARDTGCCAADRSGAADGERTRASQKSERRRAAAIAFDRQSSRRSHLVAVKTEL